MLSLLSWSFAQQRITVTGRVMAADSAIGGATVQVKGATTYTSAMNFLPIERAEVKRDPNVSQSPGWQ